MNRPTAGGRPRLSNGTTGENEIMDLVKIEEKLDKTVAAGIPVSTEVGGISLKDIGMVMEFAKIMSLSKKAVPSHLRGEPGDCLAIIIQANEWRMSPYAVARMSYVVNDQIAYMSQLIHAVVEARAPLRQRLRVRYEGEGAKRRCTIIGHFAKEVEPLEYTSPEIGSIKVKNSPLWVSDPDQQLFYYSTRAWARRHCPDVLMGIYAEDELPAGPEHAMDITPDKPQIGERLRSRKPKGDKAEGFDRQQVEDATNSANVSRETQTAESDASSQTAQAGGEQGDDAVRTDGGRAPPPESSQTSTTQPPAAESEATAAIPPGGDEPGGKAAGADDPAAEPSQAQSQAQPQAEQKPEAPTYPDPPKGVDADWWGDQMKAIEKVTGIGALERIEDELERAFKNDPAALKIALAVTAARAKIIMAASNKGKKR